ncbi:glycosyltransferase [Runella zeae]|uniref:glycosyltransferase n=1 Tax=Runella zeae TaxID=94255 RepID=UPI000400C23E|nr:glycosyltransferase [Runella zeae]
MKIIFICSSLELGKDGVGDYTRRLTGELIRQGHRVSIVALHDKHINIIKYEIQIDQNSEIDTLRLPSCISWNKRIEIAKKYVNELNPEWLSLQYVPYGYHNKGLPFFLPKILQMIGPGRKWHIMFHEMWIGITVISPLKHKIYGLFQSYIARSIIRILAPEKVNTSNKLYQLVLKSKKIESDILPLFSNIRFVKLNKEYADDFSERYNLKVNDLYIIGLFGDVSSSENIKIKIEEEINRVKYTKKQVVFLHFGNVSDVKILHSLKEYFYGKCHVIILGNLPENEISFLFQMIDKGMTATPKEHLGKSGVYAAMMRHKLDVLIPNENYIPEYQSAINSYTDYLFSRPYLEWDVEHVSKLFVTYLLEK